MKRKKNYFNVEVYECMHARTDTYTRTHAEMQVRANIIIVMH